MQYSTPADLHAAFVSAIQGLTPSYAHASEKTWHHKPAMREFAIETGDLRWFYLVSNPGTPTEGGGDGFFFSGDGVSYSYDLEIVTCYTGAPTDQIDFIVDADAADLWWLFEGLYDPTTPGLYSIEPQGNEQVDGGESNVVFVHRFRVVYNRQVD